MNFYSHHIGDFNNATRHLTRIERSIYRDLLDEYYDTEAPLSSDFDKLARRVLVAEDDKAAMRDVLNEFFVEVPDGWGHKRCDAEIAKYQAMADGGKRGAAKRWAAPHITPPNVDPNSPPIATPIAPLSPPHRPPNANHEPGTINQEPKKEARKRATPIECPEGVDAAVWADWLTLRKAKRAPVTATVLDGARDEAAKAGMSLDAFLRVWCKRSSQGLEAAWLKRDERPGPSATVEHNPQLDRTAEWLREQDQARARSTPPPAAILAMVSKIGRTA